MEICKSANDLQQRVIDYVVRSYSRKRRVPSIRQILRNAQTYRSLLYRAFPGGMADICSAAGVPEPDDRIQTTSTLSKIHRSDPLEEFKKGLAYLEKSVMNGDRDACSEYIVMILPYLDEIRSKFDNFCSIHKLSKEQAARDAVSWSPSYLEEIKAATVKGKRPPAVRDYVRQILIRWIESCHREYGPITRPNVCPLHRRKMYLQRGRGALFLYCEDYFGSLWEHSLKCEFCQGEMTVKEPERLLTCESCSFSIRFEPHLELRKAAKVQRSVPFKKRNQQALSQEEGELEREHRELLRVTHERYLAEVRLQCAQEEMRREQAEAELRQLQGRNQIPPQPDPRVEEELRKMDPLQRNRILRIHKLINTQMTPEESGILLFGDKEACQKAGESWERRVLGRTIEELTELDRRARRPS